MSTPQETDTVNNILRVRDTTTAAIENFCGIYGLVPALVSTNDTIPGSFWGDTEAGLIGNTLYLREDTPLHSLLHEACHFICMSADRREHLDTNAGGDYDEENGVCYLQILLSVHLPPLDPTRIMEDMDRWGYSFRLGSTARWFHEDARDARDWLIEHDLITTQDQPTGKLRGH